MKTLLLLRHSKAENAAPGSSDIDRALNERGRNEAQAMGTFIRKQNLTFELVLCSPALRARETAELVLAAAEITANVRYDQRIYEASPRQLLEVISEVEEDKSAVLLVGHNPGMEELLRALTGNGEPMATGTLAKIDFNFDEWSRVTEDIGALECIVRPNELAAG
jgi:phosphohistidine phosphatase